MKMRPFAAAMTAKVTARVEVIDERRGSEIPVVLADAVDQRPQSLGVGRAHAPAGKECTAIHERQGDAEIKANQRLARQSRQQPIQHLLARPAMTGPDQLRRCAVPSAQANGDALVSFSDGSGPVDRGEVFEAATHLRRLRTGFIAAACAKARPIISRTRSGSGLSKRISTAGQPS